MINGLTFEQFLGTLQYKLGKSYTEEQVEFMKDFRESTLSFSDPGVGKTHASIGGLLTVELFHGVPGDQIYAMSFTNMATAEIAIRHKVACDELKVKQKVNFQTLHKICMGILKEHHQKLGFRYFERASSIPYRRKADFILSKAEAMGMEVKPYSVGKIISSINTLNSSLIFDREHVESTYAFANQPLSFENLTMMRYHMYNLSRAMNSVQLDQILLYTLELLLKHPEIGEEFKKKCKVLLVDEFQDLSLLQLKVISLIADNVVAIGDIKQQIYAFNGACQEIVHYYGKYFPNHKVANLTQSFRCGDKIAEYASRIIAPNKVGGEGYKGTGAESHVNVVEDYDLAEIVDNIHLTYLTNNNTFPKSIMFLFRVNASITPLVEELFQRQIPFRTGNDIKKAYKPAHTLPVISQLCQLIDMVRSPNDPEKVSALGYLIPELSKYIYGGNESPIAKAMKMSGSDVFAVHYEYKNPAKAEKAFDVLLDVQQALNQNKKVDEIFGIMMELYTEAYITPNIHKFPQLPDYYFRVVESIISAKTYNIFIAEELEKAEYSAKCINERMGLMALTFHAAKGTEADIVNILDANDGLIPHGKKLRTMYKAGCIMDVAREIRNERSLAFVASTRAKLALNIYYTGKLAPMFVGENPYQEFDQAYFTFDQKYLDVENFQHFTKGVI